MSTPNFRSSPWIRGAPHNGLAHDIVRINARTSLAPMDGRCGGDSSRSRRGESPGVPSDHGLRLHDDECRSPARPHAGQRSPEPAVRGREAQPSRPCALQHVQLVAQGQDLEMERGCGPQKFQTRRSGCLSLKTIFVMETAEDRHRRDSEACWKRVAVCLADGCDHH
jgi:hypothetical protein